MFDLKQYMEINRAAVDARLHKYLDVAGKCPAQEKIIEAMSYSVFAGGKRLRPILCLAAAQAVGGRIEDVLPAACAIELLHTYSLIHDDLPCMDNDDYRRGRLTNHKVFGEDMAVLAGDGLLTLTFEILSSELQDRPAKALAVIAELAKAGGWQGMIAGQVMDLLSEHKKLTKEEIELLHRQKTGALIEASLKIGAVLSDAQPHMIEALSRYGQAFGLVFQITDDILDVIGDAGLMGKNTGSDQAKEKATYPSLFGIEASKLMAQEGVVSAKAALADLPGDTTPLAALADYLIQRES